MLYRTLLSSLFFFFNDTATTEIYTLSLHDALPILIPQCEPSASVRVQLALEVVPRGKGGSAASPHSSVTGFEQMQRQLFFTNEMLIKRGIREAALLGNVTDAGRSQAAFAKELHCRPEDFPFGGRIILANVERKWGGHTQVGQQTLTSLSNPMTCRPPVPHTWFR